jgi:hypothetical protein
MTPNNRITKKERIIELLRKRTPPEKIALEVGTSIEYVYKENSRYNRRTELVETQRHESIYGTRNELVRRTPDLIEVAPDPNFPLASRPEQVMQNYYNFKPITETDSKDMYDRFLKNQDAAQVIGATGFHPELVQKEYLRYQDMKSRDPIELQKLIVSKVKDIGPELEPIMNKLKKEILLTNDELLTFIHYYSHSQIYNAIIRMVSDAQVLLPEGLKKVKCNFCGRPVPGMIIDPESQIGKRFNEIIAGFRCASCMEKLDEELRLANSWSELTGNRGESSEVAATNGTDLLAAVDGTSEIKNTNTAVRNSSDTPGTNEKS